MNYAGALQADTSYKYDLSGFAWNTATFANGVTGTGSFTHKFTIGVPLVLVGMEILMNDDRNLLELRNISKTFPGVKALDREIGRAHV